MVWFGIKSDINDEPADVTLTYFVILVPLALVTLNVTL